MQRSDGKQTNCVCNALAASECRTAYGEVDPEQHSVAVLLGSDVPQTLSGADVDAPSYDDASQHEDNGVGNVLQLLPADPQHNSNTASAT